MPYINRSEQLHNTLISYYRWYRTRNDYEVIIVEDSKNQDNLREVAKPFDNIRIIKNEGYDGYNPSVHFNLGVRESQGEIIVITNPEIFHKSNVLAGFDKEFQRRDNAYVVCACEHGKRGTKRCDKFNDFEYIFDKFGHHSTKRNTGYHWCTGITKRMYEKIGGFDEEFADGYAGEDDEFIWRIRNNKSIQIINRDDLLVVHQWHPKQTITTGK